MFQIPLFYAFRIPHFDFCVRLLAFPRLSQLRLAMGWTQSLNRSNPDGVRLAGRNFFPDGDQFNLDEEPCSS